MNRSDEAVTSASSSERIAPECIERANHLWERYEHTHDTDLLMEIMDLEREALALCPAAEEHPDRAARCGNLAITLKTRFECTGDDHLLEEAINLHREALSLRPEGHPDRAMSCGNLASSLSTRYMRSGDDHLLAEAIDLDREALALRPEGHPHRAISCGNLALSLTIRCDRTGDYHLLNEAIDLYCDALTLCSEEHPQRAVFCNNLALSLLTRFEHTGNEFLLNGAINLHREALSLRLIGHPQWAPSCVKFASSLRTRYEYTGDERLLDEAIDLHRQSLALIPEGDPDRATFCGDLASSLLTRYEHGGDEQLLAEAIDLQSEVLTLRHEGHPDRAASCSILALSLWSYYTRTRDDNLLKKAIDLQCEASTLWPVHGKWRSTLNLCWMYLQQNTPFYSVTMAIRFLDQTLQYEPDDIPSAINGVMSNLNILWSQYLEGKHHASQALMSAYQQVINFLPLIVNPVLDITSQLKRSRFLSRVGADAFVNAVLAGHWEAGIENLDMAQGVIWAQRLHQRDPQLRNVPEPLATELEACLHIITRHDVAPSLTPEHPFLTSQDVLHKNSVRMFALIQEIRAIPGLERFMLGETAERLCGVALHHPVVVLVGARGHFYALIMVPGGITRNVTLRLKLTKDDFRSQSTIVMNRAYRGGSGPDNTQGPDIDTDARGVHVSYNMSPLERHLQFLWLYVVKPVLDALEIQPSTKSGRPRLHWCPTGPFTSMPLHAAGIYNRAAGPKICCADYVVSSYTPTLTTLLRSQSSVVSKLRGELALTLVSEGQAKDEQLPLQTLPGVDAEISNVLEAAQSGGVSVVERLSGSTTIIGTAEAIKRANIIHLACHGIQDPQDATRSGFCLGDGRLTIAGLMELNIKDGFLAFLSACETAKGSEEQPDQAMHLAAAMLFTGFKSVIATMWAISDEDGTKVAKWFYEALFAKEVINADTVAYALDAAVTKLRKSGVPPHRWVPFIHMGA